MTDTTGDDEAVVIERTFDAPVDVMWKMWTDPEHFKAWYGPTGANIPVVTMDLRIGGARFVGMEMKTPNGTMQMYFTGKFIDIVENRRLVYTEAMADEHGNVIPPETMGMPANHPATTEVRVELVDVETRTKMVLTHHGIPSGSPGETGWFMAFDKLADYAVTQVHG